MQLEALRCVVRNFTLDHLVDHLAHGLPKRAKLKLRSLQQCRLQSAFGGLQVRPCLGKLAFDRGVAGQLSMDQTAMLLDLRDHVEAETQQRISARFKPRRFERLVRSKQGLAGQPGQRSDQHDRHQHDLGAESQAPHQGHARLQEKPHRGRVDNAHPRLQTAVHAPFDERWRSLVWYRSLRPALEPGARRAIEPRRSSARVLSEGR